MVTELGGNRFTSSVPPPCAAFVAHVVAQTGCRVGKAVVGDAGGGKFGVDLCRTVMMTGRFLACSCRNFMLLEACRSRYANVQATLVALASMASWLERDG